MSPSESQSPPFGAGAALTRHRITVLLIDDQAIVATAVQRMLAPEQDILFHACQDPTQALARAAEVSPTVILQDLVMPDIDGLTLVKFFRRHPQFKDIPLIVLSTKEEAATKAEAFALGANDYLVKLPDRIELVARIRYHSGAYINLLQRNEAYDALLKSQQVLAAELASAADYVQSLLPAPLAEGPVRTRWRFIPSTQLGGDCFGYHWVDADHFAMYLLDVCGHGVGSALLSVTAYNVLRSQTLPRTDFRIPEQVMARMNDTFQIEEHNDLYFTLWYGVFNRMTRELRCSSGGHPPALLMDAAGGVQRLQTQNLLVGGMPDAVYDGLTVAVPAPARLYIFSDGVYEVDRPDGSMWSLDDLEHFLLQPAEASEGEIDRLYRSLQDMHGQPVLDDDFSMIRVDLA